MATTTTHSPEITQAAERYLEQYGEPIKAPAEPPKPAGTLPSEPKPTAQEKKPPASATTPKQESPLEVQTSLPFGPRI
jgi:hypothetical protein